jgi:cytochrome c oxidase subunit II
VKGKFGLLALLGIALLQGTSTTSLASGQSSPKTITITAHRFNFTPNEITLTKGEPVILVLKSEDVAHGLGVRDLNIEMKVSAHGTTQVQVTPDKTGDFTGHCLVFCGAGHGSMTFKLHVVNP